MKKIFFGIGFLVMLSSCHQDGNIDAKPSEGEAVAVNVIPVQYSRREKQLSYSGTIEASQYIPLTFQTTGIVERIYVEEGDFVTKGQLLAEVEKGSFVSTYEGALAQYEQAVDAQTRLKSVYENGSLPEIKWVEINTKVSQAKSILELAEKNLANCELRAPTDGFIGKRTMEEGMSAVQLEAPIKMVKIETVYAKISVPENEISELKKGQSAQLSVSAIGDELFEGDIQRVGVVANQFSRTYDVMVEVQNPELKLKPGMVCDVSITLPATKAVLTIPIQAVSADSNQQTYVFVIDKNSGKAIKRRVRLGRILNNEHTVLSGLETGDLIVVNGQQKITDNAKVVY
jgi:RND family efflux transporter MFP subunit